MKFKILDTAIKYHINVDGNTLSKYQYFIARDFLGFGKIDGIMRDENIEDVSCDGTNSPIFVWHRKYESIPSNIKFETHQELENFVFKLAYLCGRHISIAQPILDGTLNDGSRAQVTYGTEVTPKGSTFTIRKFKKNPPNNHRSNYIQSALNRNRSILLVLNRKQTLSYDRRRHRRGKNFDA